MTSHIDIIYGNIYHNNNEIIKRITLMKEEMRRLELTLLTNVIKQKNNKYLFTNEQTIPIDIIIDNAPAVAYVKSIYITNDKKLLLIGKIEFEFHESVIDINKICDGQLFILANIILSKEM